MTTLDIIVSLAAVLIVLYAWTWLEVYCIARDEYINTKRMRMLKRIKVGKEKI